MRTPLRGRLRDVSSTGTLHIRLSGRLPSEKRDFSWGTPAPESDPAEPHCLATGDGVVLGKLFERSSNSQSTSGRRSPWIWRIPHPPDSRVPRPPPGGVATGAAT